MIRNEGLKNIARAPIKIILQGLSQLEKTWWPDERLQYSPVFIVSPPRAGSTLLYQLMTRCMTTAYFSNFALRLRVQGSAVIPVMAARIAALLKINQRQGKTFSSYYGASAGWGDPHEAHWIWDSVFPADQHAIPPGYLTKGAQKEVYRMVAGTERAFNRPFVNKHIRNSVRIEALAEIFPTALFAHCRRNPLDIAQSIYLARTRDFPFAYDAVKDPLNWWFAVKPKEYPEIKKKGMIAQVCEQVYYVEKSIAQARARLGSERFTTIDYKNLCAAPQEELAKLHTFMNARNAPVSLTCRALSPFPYAGGRKKEIDAATYAAFVAYLQQLGMSF